MTTAFETDVQRGEALLREVLQPGTTVRTILRHRASSGMTRWISLIVIGIDWKKNEPVVYDISWAAAKFCGWSVNTRNHDGIQVSGAGMDMGFHVVYSLSRHLWPEGFPCIGEKCPANDHVNGHRDYTPGNIIHRDGGYALNHRWL